MKEREPPPPPPHPTRIAFLSLSRQFWLTNPIYFHCRSIAIVPAGFFWEFISVLISKAAQQKVMETHLAGSRSSQPRGWWAPPNRVPPSAPSPIDTVSTLPRQALSLCRNCSAQTGLILQVSTTSRPEPQKFPQKEHNSLNLQPKAEDTYKES